MLRAVTMLAICASSLPAFADGDDRLDLGASLVRGSRMRPGEIEVSGPLFAARYGLTDDTSVGAAAWPVIGFLGSGGGAQLALDRFGRVGDRWYWDAGGAVLFFDMHPGEVGAQLRGLAVHGNIEWRTRRNALGVAVLAGGATVRGFDSSKLLGAYAGIHMEGIAVLGTYTTSPWRWLALELGLGALPYVVVATDSADGMQSTDDVFAAARIVGNLHLHVRVKHWRVSLGGALAPLLGLGVPSLTIARRW